MLALVSHTSLSWDPAALPSVVVLVTATVAYLLYTYHLTPRALAGSDDPEVITNRGVLRSRLAGGALFCVASVASLLALGRSPIEEGLALPHPLRTLAVLGAAALVLLPVVALNSRTPKAHADYPALRAARWTPGLVARNGLAWTVYLLGYEYLFRGFLLFVLARAHGPWPALAITTALYALAHLNKPASETWGTLVMGFGFGAMALYTGGFWVAFLLHLAIANTADLTAARTNPSVAFLTPPKDPPA